MHRSSSLVFLALMAALSLCMSPQEPGPAGFSGDVFDGEGAMVRGQVLNDELLPIQGAQVGILEPKRIVETDATGRFEMFGVPEGTVSFYASALGYASMSKTISVTIGGEVPELVFTLAAVPITGPHHVIDVFRVGLTGYGFKLTPDCMYTGVHPNAKTCVGGFNCDPGPCEVHYGHCEDGGAYAKWGCRLTPDWVTIVGEVRWQPQSSATGRGVTFEVLGPNVTRGGADGHSGSVDQGDPRAFVVTTANSPIQILVNQDVLDQRQIAESDRCGGVAVDYPNCDWGWRAYPGKCTVYGVTGGAAGCDAFGPDFNVDELSPQPVDIYFSFFIQEPAPEGWTALPDQ